MKRNPINNQDFIRKLTELVEANLKNEQFGVSDLAREMGISRSSLYVRVNTIKKTSISRFINEIRLKKAKEILQQTSLSVSEVAYEVGFGSPTYFSKCFRDYYGFPPGEVVQDVSNGNEANIEQSQDSPAPKKNRKKKWMVLAAVIVFVILAISFIWLKPFASASKVNEKSIAVLPFKNLSEDPENQYFADGVTESIMENLNIIRDLKVISRTSAERYRENSGKTLAQIASELEVSYVLEGSVQKNGDQLRIWVKLIEVGRDEEQIWSHQYDRHIRDLFAVQNEIAQQVAIALRIMLTPEESLWIGAIEPTKSMEAWDLYIRSTQPKKDSKRDYEQAIQKLNGALKLDPNFGRAYCSLGADLYKLREFGAPESVWRDSSLSLIQKSIEINPERSSPYRYMADIYKTVGDEKKVYASLIKGLENYPNDYIIMRNLAHYYERKGEFEKAIDYALKNLTIDRPNEEEVNYYEKLGKLFLNFDWQLAEQYYEKSLKNGYRTNFLLKELYKFEFRKKNYQNALNYALAMSEIAPKRYSTLEALGYGHMFTRQYAKAEENFEEAVQMKHNMTEDPSLESYAYRLHLALVKNHLGKLDEAKKIIDAHKAAAMKVIVQGKDNSEVSGAWFTLAKIQAYEGNVDGALNSLKNWHTCEQDKRTNDPLRFLLADPFFDPLRSEEEFQHIVDGLLKVEAENKKLLREKLKECHKRKELRWLKLGRI